MKIVEVFLFLIGLACVTFTVLTLLNGKRNYVVAILGIFSFSAMFLVSSYIQSEERSKQTKTTEELPYRDPYEFRIGEQKKVKKLTKMNDYYNIGYAKENDDVEWLEIREKDDSTILIETKYDKNRKKATFVREKNIPAGNGGYRKHYVLYIGNETELSKAEHKIGVKVIKTVKEDIIQKN